MRDEQVAEKVAVLAARRRTQQEIADAVDLSVKTLCRIYADELAAGAQLIRDAIFEGQVRKAAEGNTQAARFVEAVLTKSDATEVAYRAPAAGAAKPGKKEERQAAAEEVGGKYAPGAPPASIATH